MEQSFNPDFIIEHIGLYLGTCRRAILSDSRAGVVSDARQICMYFSYKLYERKYTALSPWFNRSIWGVRYGVETVAGLRTVDKEFDKKIKMCERHLMSQHVLMSYCAGIDYELICK